MYIIEFILTIYIYTLTALFCLLVFKYLEFCVSHLRSSGTSVHNFLVSSYANSNDPSDHHKLQDYLVKQTMVSKM